MCGLWHSGWAKHNPRVIFMATAAAASATSTTSAAAAPTAQTFSEWVFPRPVFFEKTSFDNIRMQLHSWQELWHDHRLAYKAVKMASILHSRFIPDGCRYL